MPRGLLDKMIYGLGKRPPLDDTRRACLALSSMYSRVDGRADDGLEGHSPWTRQMSWDMLRGAWKIEGRTIAAKRDKAREVLAWLRDEGERTEGIDGVPPGDLFAWDAARLVHVTRACRHARFLEEDEAWDWLKSAGLLVRPVYPGWDGYAQAFLRAREAWAGGADPMMNEATRALLTEDGSIWRSTPWTALPAS